MSAAAPLRVRGLRVVLPDGRELIRELSLEVRAGEVAVLLGGSGSGKSTLSRVLFERDELVADGFELSFDEVSAERDKLGLVPQRGALFDHLDVAGNLELAHRYRLSAAEPIDVGDWLSRVGLDPELAGADPSSLSGGQAQRVAVARTLVAGREILFLDEPSVGLDPARVRQLARLIREQVNGLGIAAVVVTHDVALAGGVADTLHYLDADAGGLRPLFDGEWPGPLEADSVTDDERGRWLVALERSLVDAIERPGDESDERSHPTRSAAARRLRGLAGVLTRPFAVAGYALRHGPPQLLRRPRDFARIAGRVALQSLIRPLPFYLIVSVLIGYTVLFVISKIGGAGVRPDALIRQIGGSYVLALAPPLSAVLFVAASGAAVNAWLGSVTLTRQVLALEALGIDPRAYLWAPAWFAVAIAYLIAAAVIGAGMIGGGWLLANQLGMDDAFALLTADLFDPRPDRSSHLSRALLLVWIYGWGIASDSIAKGTANKRSADDVTRAMTASVVACTLWVVAWELATVLWVFE